MSVLGRLFYLKVGKSRSVQIYVTQPVLRPVADGDSTRLPLEQHVSVQMCLSPSRTGREDVPGPRLAAGKCSASMLPTSSFPVCSHFPTYPSPPSGTCRLPEPRSEWPEMSPEPNACVLAERFDKTQKHGEKLGVAAAKVVFQCTKRD